MQHHDLMLLRYDEHRRNAEKRDIPFNFTFEEWSLIWIESGKWEQRGWGKGQYCMARPGDKGAYEVGNVMIVLAEDNRAERNKNYRLTGSDNPAYGQDYWATATLEERNRRAESVGAKLRGIPKTSEHTAKVTQAAIGRRLVTRNGRRVWAHPGDSDYPG